MRPVLGWIGGVVVLIVLALGGTETPAAQACSLAIQRGAPPLRWHGTWYDDDVTDVPRAPVAGRTLHDGMEDNPVPLSAICQPLPPDFQPFRPVSVRALKGVRPRIALVRASDPQTTLLAPGFLLELESHPLHDYVRLPRTRSRLFSCRRTSVVHTHLDGQPGAFLRQRLETGRGWVKVILRPSTKMHVRHRAGMPYLAGDEHLTIRGCLPTFGDKIAATEITADY